MMEIAIDLARYVAICYLSMVGPFNAAMLVRAAVHDHGYQLSLTDIFSGACVATLIVFGMPKF